MNQLESELNATEGDTWSRLILSFLLSLTLNAAIFLSLNNFSHFRTEESPHYVEISRIVSTQKKVEPTADPPVKPQPKAIEQRIVPNIIKERKIRAPLKKSEPLPIRLNEEPRTTPSAEVRINSVEAEPVVQVKPEIPEELKASTFKSFVRVKVEVQKDGTSIPALRSGSGNSEIDRRVLAALQKWRWKTAEVDGVPVASVRYFKFEFEVK